MLHRIIAAAALAAVSAPSALAAAGGCHAIAGTYSNRNVPCVVPALACVETIVTGDLAGTSSTIILTFDRTTTAYTGLTTNVLENGAVITSTIVGSFAGGGSTQTFTGGTRQFAHAVGSLTTNSAAGTYAGEFCLGGASVGYSRFTA
jgi:hypothetical protein